ncbi:hypothetical protein BD414DRAFT_152863 [Trametes punicea]|nr:hypothetical protein BD414DRAFT_152863 [Trametes punicea]
MWLMQKNCYTTTVTSFFPTYTVELVTGTNTVSGQLPLSTHWAYDRHRHFYDRRGCHNHREDHDDGQHPLRRVPDERHDIDGDDASVRDNPGDDQHGYDHFIHRHRDCGKDCSHRQC